MKPKLTMKVDLHHWLSCWLTAFRDNLQLLHAETTYNCCRHTLDILGSLTTYMLLAMPHPHMTITEVYLLTKWHLDPSRHLATIDMGQKLGTVPPFFGWGLVSHLTQSPGPRTTSIPINDLLIARCWECNVWKCAHIFTSEVQFSILMTSKVAIRITTQACIIRVSEALISIINGRSQQKLTVLIQRRSARQCSIPAVWWTSPAAAQRNDRQRPVVARCRPQKAGPTHAYIRQYSGHRENSHVRGLLISCCINMHFSFSALTLLVGRRKGIRPVKTEWWATGVVICIERDANDLRMVQLMPLPAHHLWLQ